MGFGIIAGIIAIFIGSFLIYGAIMVFWPEWVGITGKTALDYERSHVEGSETQTDHDLVDRIQKVDRSSEV